MKQVSYFLLYLCLSALPLSLFAAQPDAPAKPASTKAERNLVAEGNKLYREGNFTQAEVKYRKALEANAASETAAFNLAAALLKQSKPTPPAQNGEQQQEDKTLQEATQLLTKLSKEATNQTLAELSSYNLGNVAFNSGQYEQSINHYKQALRKNPDNDKARQNLRLAQLKLQQNQNQDKNKDNKDKDKDKDKNKDKDKDKDQNKDQDKNKDNKDKDKDQNKDQNQNQDQQKQNQQNQQQQGGMSQQNAEQILKAMENQEKATRARVNAEKGKQGQAGSRQVLKPW